MINSNSSARQVQTAGSASHSEYTTLHDTTALAAVPATIQKGPPQMHLATPHNHTNPAVPLNSARQQCTLAQQLENSGKYEEARAALAGRWHQIGEPPDLTGLDQHTRAELLLRAGALSGWIGSTRQIAGAQGFAKDLISESIRLFQNLPDENKVAEAQTDLAICYWREGALDEARVVCNQALAFARSPHNIVRTQTNRALIEVASGQVALALNILNDAAPLLQTIDDNGTTGRYHSIRAVALKRTGGAANLDRALIEYTAASHHFEQAGHAPFYASCENNLSLLFIEVGRYADAHRHLDNASRTFTRLRDLTKAAQTHETRARIFIAQGRYSQAAKSAAIAITALKNSGEQALLAEAHTTQAVALARLEQYATAQTAFQTAAEIALTAGDTRASIVARLTSIEELATVLTPLELFHIYTSANQLISENPDLQLLQQIRNSAAITISSLRPEQHAAAAAETSDDLNLAKAIHRCEADVIRRALAKTNHRLSPAARLLGMSRQGLCDALEARHQNLRRNKPIRRNRARIKQ